MTVTPENLAEVLGSIYESEPVIDNESVLIGLNCQTGLAAVSFDLFETPGGKCELFISYSFMMNEDTPFNFSHRTPSDIRKFCEVMQEHIGWGNLRRVEFPDGEQEITLYRYLFITEELVERMECGDDNELTETVKIMIDEFNIVYPFLAAFATGTLGNFDIIAMFAPILNQRVC